MKILNVRIRNQYYFQKVYNIFKIILFLKVKILILLHVVQVNLRDSLGKQYIVLIVYAIRTQISLKEGNYYILIKTTYYQFQAQQALIKSRPENQQKMNIYSQISILKIELSQGFLEEIIANSDYILGLNFEKEIQIEYETYYLIIN
ncbi:unnamed protein product [Paramecium primaurelia]|uniref:Transmembrane protein n=1 Tax=Paramecium primaurelia TaxID=5886 RepID=A0A8S1QK67_PARPR|nr:unnamed protein product [Paramecium primaurelia]